MICIISAYFTPLSFPQASSSSSESTMLTSERSPQSLGLATAADVDMTSWKEADFEEKCTYIVKDQPLEEEESEVHGRRRAERSLPRNLALKRCHSSKEVRKHLPSFKSFKGAFKNLFAITSAGKTFKFQATRTVSMRRCLRFLVRAESLRHSNILPSTHPSPGGKYLTCCCLI